MQTAKALPQKSALPNTNSGNEILLKKVNIYTIKVGLATVLLSNSSSYSAVLLCCSGPYLVQSLSPAPVVVVAVLHIMTAILLLVTRFSNPGSLPKGNVEASASAVCCRFIPVL